jgi:hypothetical protein
MNYIDKLSEWYGNLYILIELEQLSEKLQEVSRINRIFISKNNLKDTDRKVEASNSLKKEASENRKVEAKVLVNMLTKRRLYFLNKISYIKPNIL